MRTNKDRLKAYLEEHFKNMREDISNKMKEQIGNDDWDSAKSIEIYEIILGNIYFSAIDWVSEGDVVHNLAWIRPDIIEKGLAVPVGVNYYGSPRPLPFRWLDEEHFQVLHAGIWVNAQEIDWDFTDAVHVPVVTSTKESVG